MAVYERFLEDQSSTMLLIIYTLKKGSLKGSNDVV